MDTVKSCSQCGAEFGCGAQSASCWCQELPAIDFQDIDSNLDCLCLACIKKLTRDRLTMKVNNDE